jgi:hypothetical protein
VKNPVVFDLIEVQPECAFEKEKAWLVPGF